MRWRFCHASVVCLQPQSVHLRRLYSVGSSSQMPLGMECRQNEREAERGMWERGILKYLGKKNELNRSLSNGNIKGSGMIWQFTANGSHKVTIFTIMPLELSFQLLKMPIFCFWFPSLSLKIFEFWVMETTLRNQAKHNFFCGAHEIWMMDDGNWVIWLSFHVIQTSS